MVRAFFLLALQQGAASPVAPSPTIAVARVEGKIAIDGVLADTAWQRAARLTGFHQYEPVDGRPAEERTEVLVFYSKDALHFGIIAHARNPSTVRATLADRDNIETDDRVILFLDTFNDRRRAFIFGVNPLGVQLDGVRTEGAVSAGNIFGGSIDYSPDFLFESKGRLTDSGYVVEIRIPFKSLRFPTAKGPQQWGLNVVRNNASSGYTDTWTDARRANASFLAQSGTMTGMESVERGVVTEIQPFVTTSLRGESDPVTGRFARGDVKPDAGANLRFGFPALSLDATVNPDFSQVESDAGLVTVNERFALFIPEKRPFFLEGIELFSTPGQLVYTRRIASPLAGAKLTGKVGRYSIAYLSVLDQLPGRDALFNVARARIDVGRSSLAGVTLTDRRLPGTFNTVASSDVRYVFRRLYYFEPQLAWSRTKRLTDDTAHAAPLWKLELDRTGRAWGFNYRVDGVGNGFDSDAGFVPRSGFVQAHAFNRFSLYGGRGALVENFTVFAGPTRLWNYRDVTRQSPIEGSETVGGFLNLRGGWQVNYGLSRQLVVFDRQLFAGLATRSGGGVPAPYSPPRGLSDLRGGSLGFRTPVFQRVTAGGGAARQATPIFLEGSEGTETRLSSFVTLRPSPGIRVEGSGIATRIERARDGSEFARALIPRLKAEYQPTRALFFRVVGEWRTERRDALRDARTGDRLSAGGVPVAAVDGGTLRTDWLASYEPSPGTAAFLGYGSSTRPPAGSRLADLQRVADGFFVKLAYQFRR